MSDHDPSRPAASVPAWVAALDPAEAVLRSAVDGDQLLSGMWPEDRPGLPLEAAQECLLECLAGLLPEPPAVLLVSGWGLGAPAAWLAGRGYRVLGVNGSPGRVAYAQQRFAGPRVAFAASWAADGEAVGTDDAVLALEPGAASGALDRVVERAAGVLAPQGRLVLAARTARLPSAAGRLPGATEVAVMAAEAGFVVLERLELGEAVAPTAERWLARLESRRRQVEGLLGADGQKWVEEVAGRLRQRAAAAAAGDEGYTVWSCRRDEIRLRSYREGDEHRILPVFEGLFFHRRSLEHWAWKYRDHPLGALRIAVANAPNGDLAAHYAAYPVCFRSTVPELADCESMQVGDTMTHPAYRRTGLGPTGLLSRLVHYYYDRFCLGKVPFIYGFNTGKIRAIGERYLGYEYLQEVELASAPAGRLRRSLGRRLGDRLRGWWVGRVRTVGPEHDRLLEEVAPAYGFLVRRDSTWIRWRYLELPDQEVELFEVRRRGELVGWAVFRRDEGTLRWGDALFRPDLPEATAILLDRVVRDHEEVARVVGWLAPHPPWWVGRLEALGFVRAPEPNGLAPTFKVFDPAYGVAALGRSLYFTEGDSDLF